MAVRTDWIAVPTDWIGTVEEGPFDYLAGANLTVRPEPVEG